MTAYGLREDEPQEEEIYPGDVPSAGEQQVDSPESDHNSGSVSEVQSRQHSAASAHRSPKFQSGSRQTSATSKKYAGVIIVHKLIFINCLWQFFHLTHP